MGASPRKGQHLHAEKVRTVPLCGIWRCLQTLHCTGLLACMRVSPRKGQDLLVQKVRAVPLCVESTAIYRHSVTQNNFCMHEDFSEERAISSCTGGSDCALV